MLKGVSPQVMRRQRSQMPLSFLVSNQLRRSRMLTSGAPCHCLSRQQRHSFFQASLATAPCPTNNRPHLTPSAVKRNLIRRAAAEWPSSALNEDEWRKWCRSSRTPPPPTSPPTTTATSQTNPQQLAISPHCSTLTSTFPLNISHVWPHSVRTRMGLDRRSDTWRRLNITDHRELNCAGQVWLHFLMMTLMVSRVAIPIAAATTIKTLCS